MSDTPSSSFVPLVGIAVFVSVLGVALAPAEVRASEYPDDSYPVTDWSTSLQASGSNLCVIGKEVESTDKSLMYTGNENGYEKPLKLFTLDEGAIRQAPVNSRFNETLKFNNIGGEAIVNILKDASL